jgi:hypothetical protein
MVATISGSNIICLQQVQQQSQTATGGSATATGGSANVTVNTTASVPASTTTVTTIPGVSTTVTQLPKTGMPLAAWALSGLLPFGLGIKRFGRNSKDPSKSAHYLWQKREYLKED